MFLTVNQAEVLFDNEIAHMLSWPNEAASTSESGGSHAFQ